MGKNADAESDDEVLAEFDVCLTSQLKDSLQLFQYPLRPFTRQYDDLGYLTKVELAIDSTIEEKSAFDNKEDRGDKDAGVVVEEDKNVKIKHKLKTMGQNYD